MPGSDQKMVYYVLPEGATQEQEWSWVEIEQLCASGALTADTKIFIPADNEWRRIGETELAASLAGARAVEDSDAEDEPDHRREAYEAALLRLEEDPSSTDHLVRAGQLAAELGEAESAWSHFQRALELSPFNQRVALAAKRALSTSEWRRLRLLERQPPVWDNILEPLTYPLARGPLYLLAPLAVLAALAFVPYGAAAMAALCFLWGYQVTRRVAAGDERPPLWQPAVGDWVAEIALPTAGFALVCAEWGALFYGISWLGVAIERPADPSVIAYITHSPVLIVAIATVAISYLPAVIVQLAGAPREIVAVANPVRMVRFIALLGGEYFASAACLFLLAFALGWLGFVTSQIPLAGRILVAAAGAYALLMGGFVLGRLVNRTMHLRERAASPVPREVDSLDDDLPTG